MIENLLPQASTYADDIDNLFMLVVYIVGFWYIITKGMFLWLLYRYRAKEGVPAEYVTGKEPHLKRWVTIPHGLIILCDIVLIVGAIKVWHHVKLELPPAQETVHIIAQQWAWTFVQPGPDGLIETEDDITTIDELHVRNDTLYHYKLMSKDVLHDFSVPVFRLKQDALPGREITGWFHPTLEGAYDLQCAEMCGIGHGIMNAMIYVESKEEHEAWMQSMAGTKMAAQ